MKKFNCKKIVATILSATILVMPITTHAAGWGWGWKIPTRWNYSYNVQEEQKAEAPQNVDASYKHKGMYSYLKDHLEVTWDEVTGTEEYTVRVIKEDGTSKDYTTEYTILLQYNDEFVTNCIAGGMVQVKADNSDWSDPVKISHNQFHFD